MDSVNPFKYLHGFPQVLWALVAASLTACAPAVRPDAAPTTPVDADAAVTAQAPAAEFTVPELGPDPAEATLPPGDLWERIREGITWADAKDPRIDHQLRWYASNQDYLDRVVTRAQPYFRFIVDELEKRGMPMELALLPIVESAYDPFAYSHGRAAGLWQFIPGTGRRYSLKLNWWYDGRRDVIASTGAALDYLEKLYAQFNDWQLALAAYNCGEGKVERLINQNRRKGLPTDYSSLKKLPRETKNYVPKLMAIANIVADPAKYGLQLAAIPNSEYFARVETDGQIDLGVVARLTDMPVDELYMINPGYSRWITDPKGPHALLIPAAKKDAVLEGLSKLANEDRVQWARHEVKRGDTMSRIAGAGGPEYRETLIS